MILPLAGASSTLDALASWVRDLATAMATGFHVEHRDNGKHRFVWVRPLRATLAFNNWTLTTFMLCKYVVIDKQMTLAIDFTGTVPGTPQYLEFTIPGGYRSVDSMCAGAVQYNDAGTAGVGNPVAVGGAIFLYKNILGTAWTAGTARVQGVMTFEVQ